MDFRTKVDENFVKGLIENGSWQKLGINPLLTEEDDVLEEGKKTKKSRASAEDDGEPGESNIAEEEEVHTCPLCASHLEEELSEELLFEHAEAMAQIFQELIEEDMEDEDDEEYEEEEEDEDEDLDEDFDEDEVSSKKKLDEYNPEHSFAQRKSGTSHHAAEKARRAEFKKMNTSRMIPKTSAEHAKNQKQARIANKAANRAGNRNQD